MPLAMWVALFLRIIGIITRQWNDIKYVHNVMDFNKKGRLKGFQIYYKKIIRGKENEKKFKKPYRTMFNIYANLSLLSGCAKKEVKINVNPTEETVSKT